MSLDFDEYDDYADREIGWRRSARRRGGEKKIDKLKPTEAKATNTPESRILEQLKKFEPVDDVMSAEELEEKKKIYLSWVNASLEIKEPLFDDEDLVASENFDKNLSKVTHVSTGIYDFGFGGESMHINTRDAKINLYNKLDKHLKDWRRSSPEFKKAHGIEFPQ